MKRYSDAYLVARAVVAIGGVVKNVALILGSCIVLMAIFAFTQDTAREGVLALIVGVIVTVPIYVLGVLVAAQGQILKATLDTAVTNSPFLDKEEMAKVMSL